MQRVEWSFPKLRDELEKDPHDSLKEYRVAFADGKGVSWDLDKTFNAQTRIEVCDVKHWARNNI